MKTHDIISIDNLEVFANHGLLPEETSLGQKFLISLRIYTNTRIAGISDKIEDSIHYGEISHYIVEYTKSHPRTLIEAAAEDLAMALLSNYTKIEGVSIIFKKPWAPVGLPLETVAIEITRFRHRAYLALGSNMGDKKAYLDYAVKELKAGEYCHVVNISPYITTKPYGYEAQDDFLNACLALDTLLSPEELLSKLQEIETGTGRKREIRWGPRTLDIDILLYDELVMVDENLVIPHPEMHKREFVLKPLSEIAPYIIHPVKHMSIRELLDNLNND